MAVEIAGLAMGGEEFLDAEEAEEAFGENEEAQDGGDATGEDDFSGEDDAEVEGKGEGRNRAKVAGIAGNEVARKVFVCELPLDRLPDGKEVEFM